MSAGRASAQRRMATSRRNLMSALREMKRGCAAFYAMHRADVDNFLNQFNTARRVSRCITVRLP